jgi:ParB family chromosome partitioning protein
MACVGGSQLLVTDRTSDLIRMIAVSDLRPGPWQPRTLFDQPSLEELAASMKTQGVLTPLRVVPISGDAHGYFIVAGERRWRAAGIAGITDLPCMVMDQRADEGALRQMALLDNLHRSNLRPGEEARGVAELDRLGMSNRLIADRLGKSQVWVSHRLAIARLPESALRQLDQGRITIEEARGLAGVSGNAFCTRIGRIA